MYEIRKNIITGELVVVATERAKRPYEFERKIEYVYHDEKCMFCPGNEDCTPPNNDGVPFAEDWRIRIFQNKFPAVSDIDLKIEKTFYETISGYGTHDVVVDTRLHHETILDFSKEHLQAVFIRIVNRKKQLWDKPYIKHIQVFKNSGVEAGASIRHSHWQILSLPVMPKRHTDIYNSNKQYIAENGNCLLCDMVKNEQNEKKRLIDENDSFISFAPYAPSYHYETWIMAKRHISDSLHFAKKELLDLAEILLKSLKRLHSLMPDVAVNICFEESSKAKEHNKYFHFHVVIYPRRGNLAGFELGTGSYICMVSPELCAKELREADI